MSQMPWSTSLMPSFWPAMTVEMLTRFAPDPLNDLIRGCEQSDQSTMKKAANLGRLLLGG